MDTPSTGRRVVRGERTGGATVPTLEVLRARDGIVYLRGELEITTVDAALDHVERWAPSGEAVLDLEGVTFIDLRALRALMALAGRTVRDGGQLVLRRPSPQVSRLLEVSQTAGCFRIEPLADSTELA